jgi:hypothetical protein
MENSRLSPEQFDIIMKRLAEAKARGQMGVKELPNAPLSDLNPANRQMENMPGQLGAKPQFENMVAQNANELSPENKLDALRRLQQKNFLEPQDKEQMNQLEQEEPRRSEEIADVLKRKQVQDQLKGLFPSQ